MKREASFLAIDLGAESGRAVVGTLKRSTLQTRELHRFPNQLLSIHGHLHWDIWRLYNEIRKSLAICGRQGIRLQSIGIDTWGVDFGLLASDGSILGLPYSYRDSRTDNAIPAFFRLVPRRRIYELTGIQFAHFNTLFQLYSMVRDGSPLLKAASDLLFMPDLFNYLLTGKKQTEFTFATTSQLYNPSRHKWAPELFAAMRLSTDLMQKVVKPGTIIGPLLPEVGLADTQLVATASHDTASAVAAVPAEDKDWMYVSSGTWSLVGIETRRPETGAAPLRLNFTNEGGVAGRYRFLKNVTGMWPLQQCMKSWAAQGTPADYANLTREAARVPACRRLIDTDATDFRHPADMASAIRRYCARTKQSRPGTEAEFARCVFDSLALKYRQVLAELRQAQASPINRIHVVGGGSKNRLLCRLTADATGLPVIAGPVEATAIGNIMVQAMALGHVSSLEEIRDTVRKSFTCRTYRPRKAEVWDKAYERFKDIAK